MLASILIYGLTAIAVIATLIFAIWTFVDTRRKYSHQNFLISRHAKQLKAEERFKNKTRLRK